MPHIRGEAKYPFSSLQPSKGPCLARHLAKGDTMSIASTLNRSKGRPSKAQLAALAKACSAPRARIRRGQVQVWTPGPDPFDHSQGYWRDAMPVTHHLVLSTIRALVDGPPKLERF